MKSVERGDFFLSFLSYELNFLNSYRAVQIMYFILGELWWLMFFKKLVHFI